MALTVTPEDLLIEFVQNKKEMQRAEAAMKEAQKKLIAMMQKQKRDRVQAQDASGGTVAGTLVAAERVVLDEEGLVNALNDEQKTLVTETKVVLVKERLEAAVALNKVPLSLVDEHSEVKASTPYVRVSGDFDADTLGMDPDVIGRKVKPLRGRR